MNELPLWLFIIIILSFLAGYICAKIETGNDKSA